MVLAAESVVVRRINVIGIRAGFEQTSGMSEARPTRTLVARVLVNWSTRFNRIAAGQRLVAEEEACGGQNDRRDADEDGSFLLARWSAKPLV